MKGLVLLSLLLLLGSRDQVIVNVPTADAESQYIWRNVQDIPFFEQNGYQVAFPPVASLESLKEKARSRSLSDKDYEVLTAELKSAVYSEGDYDVGFEKVEEALPLVDVMLDKIKGLDLNWDFKIFSQYNVNLTLYGPGGSYDPETGHITLFTTPQGQFKQYANPANTIIHEIVHMGIEASLINKYEVPHSMKERIVDQFVMLNFKALLPDYRLQDMGDYRADEIMKSAKDLKDLDKRIEKILNE